MRPLTPKQSMFAMACIETGNRVEAYRRAYNCERMGTKTIRRKAQEVAALPHVAAQIEDMQRQARTRCEVTLEDISHRLRAIAFADITEFFDFDGKKLSPKDWQTLPPEKKACIKEIRRHPNGDITIKLHDSLRATELLGKHLGLFRDDAAQQENVQLVINIVPPEDGRSRGKTI